MFFSGAGRQPTSASLVLFLATKYGLSGCNSVGCANMNGHRPTNTRSSFPAPEAVLSKVEQRFDCVQAQTHMCPSLVGSFHPHHEPTSSPPSPPIGCFHPPRSCGLRPTRMNRDKEKATKQGETRWIISSRSCLSSVAALVTGNSPSAPASPTEEVDRWKVCLWP